MIDPTGLDLMTKKARPNIVKYPRYNARDRVFCEKWKLEGTWKNVTKSLTTNRIGQLNDAREKYSFHNLWSYDGKFCAK